jgi:hypothetical protein
MGSVILLYSSINRRLRAAGFYDAIQTDEMADGIHRAFAKTRSLLHECGLV